VFKVSRATPEIRVRLALREAQDQQAQLALQVKQVQQDKQDRPDQRAQLEIPEQLE
jgi:hypothetical protein